MIATAWLEMLPELGLAAAMAVPAAVLLAVLLARYLSRPLRQLTIATQQVADGTFDVSVPDGRGDEVGALARAFVSMAGRVGESQRGMRMLVANVSHDLKTPLTSILGFAQALRHGDIESQDIPRTAAVIHEEAQRLGTRLDDLLVLSELEDGRAVLERDQVALKRLVDGCVGRVGSRVADRGLNLSADLADGIVVEADGPKLERVLDNLLDNACKFTPSDGSIIVRTALDKSQGRRAIVEVANTAAEIDEAELPLLFEPFYRRDRARSRDDSGPPTGSGLGLAIARELMALHGGGLVARVEDGWIVFTASLPAGDAVD
jgi:two-component system sensor histidine kinase BaeS